MLSLFLTSCVSLEKQFVKNKVKSAELCKLYFPTLDKESKEIIRYKTDTITIKGDSIDCPIKTIIKDTIINGISETNTIYVPTKVKCPDSKIIRDTIETKKEIIVKDMTTELILKDTEKKLYDSENKLRKKTKQLFYIYLLASLYIGYRSIKFYIKNKTKFL